MKTFFLFITLMFSSNLLAQTKEIEEAYRKAIFHYKKKDYFTALDVIAKKFKFQTPKPKIQRLIEVLVGHTGTHFFNTYTDLELRKLNIPTTDLIMAKRNLYLGKYKYTYTRLARMPKAHRLYPEALLVKATAYMKEANYSKAVKTYKQCAEAAFQWEEKLDDKKQNYFSILKETCIIDIARIHFKMKNYKLAIRNYENIPKTSFKWPYTLLEKAWAYYYDGNYNRSLGILLTYNSPLLESYFTPEAEVLRALNYFKLCLYEDALDVVEKYYTTYAPRSNKLKNVILNQGKKDLYYFDLMFTPISDSEKENKFMRNLVTQMSKRIKFNLDLNSFYKINKEIYRNNKSANVKLLLSMQKDLKEQINHYVKVSMYRFINEIHSLSSEMFNLKLEILSQKRDLAYRNKTFKKDRSRGNFENIKRQPSQEFYTFKNAFWADELGDYSLALSSTCKTRKKELYE